METDLPFPEPFHALAAQFALLAKGRKRAVLVPYTQPGAPSSACGAHRTPIGWIYAAPEVTPEEIGRALDEDRVGELLGYGIPRKPAKADRVLVLRSASGNEIVAVACDADTEPAVRAALGALRNDGERLATESALEVIHDRLRYWNTFFNLNP